MLTLYKVDDTGFDPCSPSTVLQLVSQPHAMRSSVEDFHIFHKKVIHGLLRGILLAFPHLRSISPHSP